MEKYGYKPTIKQVKYVIPNEIKELRELLQQEEERWYHSDKSTTANNISNVQEKIFKYIVASERGIMIPRDISEKDIMKCFRGKERRDVKQKALELFKHLYD